jgi:hypothetical protein
MDDQKVTLESELHEPQELQQALKRALGADVTLSTERSPSAFRVDPTVLVALIQAGSAVLVPLITAMVSLATRKKSHVVRVEAADGSHVDIPTTADGAAVEAALAHVGRSNVVRVTLREP